MNIGSYTLRTWGDDQADRYLGDLEDCFQQLADTPGLGRQCDEIRPGLRRLEHGRHVIFYCQQAQGILISRILHRRMLPERHMRDESDEEA